MTKTEQIGELATCPFCGGRAAMFKARGEGPPYIPCCTKCSASLSLEWIEEEAERAWNTRAKSDQWQDIATAPKDGTPLLLFARSKQATAEVTLVGWYLPDLGWIEACFSPNSPVGVVPTHWQPRPAPPEGTPNVE